MPATQPQPSRKLNGNNRRNAVCCSDCLCPREGATMLGRHFRVLCIAGLLSAALGAGPARAATPDAYDPWPGLVQDIFNNRPINDGSGVIAIKMPYRAEDAAIVPVTLRTTLSPGDGR